MKQGEHAKHDRSVWLDSLQRESWQLELIVSGIIIFLLLQLYSYIDALGESFAPFINGDSDLAQPVLIVLAFFLLSYFALVTMFLIHLFLRGLWIGAIGLRSISGGFALDTLRYQPRYLAFLQDRLGKFDDYLDRLEQHASLAFSLAFLLFFAIMSFGLFFFVLVLTVSTGNFLANEIVDAWSWEWYPYLAAGILLTLIGLYLLGGLLYMIDFLSLGWVKRRRVLRKVYFPVYRFFGWITLARFYRPLYYNIIDNAFGRRLVWRYLAATFVACLLLGVNFHPYLYFPVSDGRAQRIVLEDYVDQGDPGDLPRSAPTLGSRFATEDYLEVFIPYDLTSSFEYRHQDLTPVVDYALMFLDKSLYVNDSLNYDTLLQAQTEMYRLRLNDSVIEQPAWYFYEHPVRERPGYLYDLPVYDLPRGRHLLHLDRLQVTRDSVSWRTWRTIPFFR